MQQSQSAMMTVAVLGPCIVLLTLVIIVIVVHRRWVTTRQLPASPPMKKRVVLMHNNMLYEKADNAGNESLAERPSSVPLLAMVPQVRIESCFPRQQRLSSELASVSEYEIPLDKKWEIPRDR